MKRDLKSRLSSMKLSGEIKTGRQLAEAQILESEDSLFPGEGREAETSFGRCYIRELRFPLHYRHGSTELSGLLKCSGSSLVLPARDSALENFNPRRALFLDIETTGLAGGTGTWAFLIGLGQLEGEHFLLRQYFLRRPSEERAILAHFASTAAVFPAMVSFNGKHFDLPLIQTRQLLAGFKHTEPLLHLDLLQCARNLWRKRLASRTLKSLEEALLGLKRVDDIPGAEIPAVYFDYLRRGKTERLKQVFNHNALDILSMVTLMERITKLSSGQMIEHRGESLSLGRLCLRSGRIDEGIDYLRKASAGSPDPIGGEAALELSFHYKRQKRWKEAVEIWQNTISAYPGNPTAYLELAKYHEHHSRNFAEAVSLTEKALALPACRDKSALNKHYGYASLTHRINRLKKRLRNTEKK